MCIWIPQSPTDNKLQIETNIAHKIRSIFLGSAEIHE